MHPGADVVQDLNVSRESSEITDEETVTDGDMQKENGDVKSQSSGHMRNESTCDGNLPKVDDELYNRFACYTARSLEERMVLDDPPAPVLDRLE